MNSGDWFLETIRDERSRQREEWGDDHDDAMTLMEWIAVLAIQFSKLTQSIDQVSGKPDDSMLVGWMKQRTTKLAATCSALFESAERAEDRPASQDPKAVAS